MLRSRAYTPPKHVAQMHFSGRFFGSTALQILLLRTVARPDLARLTLHAVFDNLGNSTPPKTIPLSANNTPFIRNAHRNECHYTLQCETQTDQGGAPLKKSTTVDKSVARGAGNVTGSGGGGGGGGVPAPYSAPAPAPLSGGGGGGMMVSLVERRKLDVLGVYTG